jgi:hypothetical protein
MYLRFGIAKDLGQNNMSAKQVSIKYLVRLFFPLLNALLFQEKDSRVLEYHPFMI